jgi:hypothetical protein
MLAPLVTKEFFKRSAKEGSSAEEERAVQQISHAEKKIIRTMLTVTACFIICWFPLDFYLVINYWHLKQLLDSRDSLIVILLAYVNVLLNAIIYSSHLDVFTRSWRAVRELSAANNSTGITMTHVSARMTVDTKF